MEKAPFFRIVPEGPCKLVLVVDDDDALRAMLATALRARGYAVQPAAGALEAAEFLGQSEHAPDLLICDVTMPVIDGFSFVRFIRTRQPLQRIPFIFLTARTASPDLLHGLNLGARKYVTKPFRLVDLLYTVDRLLR
jgi:CheY-like chemotaxis protein